jgi:hypothetical protein
MAMSFTPLTAQEVFTKNLSDQIIKSLSESGIITQSNHSESTGDQWLNVEDLCKYLPDHPCQNTIYKWKRKGIIPFHKRLKHLYFLRSEIDSWLKSKRGFTKHEMESIVNAEIRKGGVR